MDPSLLKDRERFKQRALATPAVEKRKNKEDDSKSSKKQRPAPRRKLLQRLPHSENPMTRSLGWVSVQPAGYTPEIYGSSVGD